MSTRAAYFFKDADDHHMVYKHHDGYPTGAAQWLGNARALAWAGARFEPDEAAAAFVAGAKLANAMAVSANNMVVVSADSLNKYPDMRGGGVRLMHKSEDPKNIFAACKQCCDIAYAYVVESKKGDWYVTAYETSFWDTQNKEDAKKLWAGPLSKMAAWAKKHEA